jgi:hypothetical protein
MTLLQRIQTKERKARNEKILGLWTFFALAWLGLVGGSGVALLLERLLWGEVVSLPQSLLLLAFPALLGALVATRPGRSTEKGGVRRSFFLCAAALAVPAGLLHWGLMNLSVGHGAALVSTLAFLAFVFQVLALGVFLASLFLRVSKPPWFFAVNVLGAVLLGALVFFVAFERPVEDAIEDGLAGLRGSEASGEVCTRAGDLPNGAEQKLERDVFGEEGE